MIGKLHGEALHLIRTECVKILHCVRIRTMLRISRAVRFQYSIKHSDRKESVSLERADGESNRQVEHSLLDKRILQSLASDSSKGTTPYFKSET